MQESWWRRRPLKRVLTLDPFPARPLLVAQREGLLRIVAEGVSLLTCAPLCGCAAASFAVEDLVNGALAGALKTQCLTLMPETPLRRAGLQVSCCAVDASTSEQAAFLRARRPALALAARSPSAPLLRCPMRP